MARVSLQALLDRSVKNMKSGINPVVKETTLEVIRRAYKEGINVQISAGFRSYAEQTALYNQGRTTRGNIVTNARAGQSNHNFGLAVDYFLTSEDGRRSLWVVNSKWRRVAAIAKSLGMSWGGDWNSFKDYPHLQMTGGLSTSQLRAGRRPNLKSKVSSSGHIVTDAFADGVLTRGERGESVKTMQGRLNKMGFNVGKIDGVFGEGTENAVKDFQRGFGLVVDGKYGPNTQKKLTEQLDSLEKTHETRDYLRRGDTGEAVKQMQQDLLLAGFDLGSSKDDGSYGPATEAAVKEMQEKGKIKVDGYYGAKSEEALDRLIEIKKRAAVKKPIVPYPGNTVKEGSAGINVERVQRAAGAKPDGKFGPATKKAVEAYQRRTGLYVDGIVGPKTWNMMF